MPTGLDTGVPRAFAAARLGVTPHTISMWVKDGWYDRHGTHHTVRVVGRTPRGRLYRWGDLLDAEQDTRNNANSRRGITRRPATGPDSWAALNVNSNQMRCAS